MPYTEGLVIKLCSFCPEPLNLTCTVCEIGLCFTCLVDHLETDNEFGHYVCLYRDKSSSKSIRKLCRKHAWNICEWLCTSSLQPVCHECLDIDPALKAVNIHSLVRRNVRRIRNELRTLTSVVKPRYDTIKEEVYLSMEAQRPGVRKIVRHVINLVTSPHPYAFNCDWREYINRRLERMRVSVVRFDGSVFEELLLHALKIERRMKILTDYARELSDKLLDYNFLQNPCVYTIGNPFIVLNATQFFHEVRKTIASATPTNPKDIEKKTESKDVHTPLSRSFLQRPNLLTTTKVAKSDKELSIESMYNGCSRFVIAADGPIYILTVLVFEHNGASMMHGIVVQNLHGQIIFDKATEVISEKSPLHCAVSSTLNQRHLVAVGSVLMEVNLEQGFVRILQRSKKWRYVDLSFTYTGSLLALQEKNKGGRLYERQYRITRCDLEGRILQLINHDTSSVYSPYRIRERIDGGICLMDRATGNLFVLNITGEIKYRNEASPWRQFSPHLLCDRYGNTLIYDNTKSSIHLLDDDMKMIHGMKLRKTVIESTCIDNENRLVCLCTHSDEEFKIQIYSYMEFED